MARPTFFQAVAASGSPAARVALYKQAADFLAGADGQANVGEVLADIGSDWPLAAATLRADCSALSGFRGQPGGPPASNVPHYALYLLGCLLGCPPATEACPVDVQRNMLDAVLTCLAAPLSSKVAFPPPPSSLPPNPPVQPQHAAWGLLLSASL